MEKKKMSLLGSRGIPARHGGFETFAEHLSAFLSARGWEVSVYCQEIGSGATYESQWQRVRLIHIPVKTGGALSTLIFDFRSILHCLRESGVVLTLGYNSAIFNVLFWVARRANVINMDGVEWKRQKWGPIAKAWFWANERFGCWFATRLVADHPGIVDHLATRVDRKKITMIPYGGREITEADEAVVREFDLEPGNYALVVARPEPENSILEVVSAFSREPRIGKLVVLGRFDWEKNKYHRQVRKAASGQVAFLGAIYEPEKVGALRFFARFYIHGHQVGGTNPSLVEALGAGNAMLCHDNIFNRWVAGQGALYFVDIASAECAIKALFEDEGLVKSLGAESRRNFESRFRWENILSQYEEVLAPLGRSGNNSRGPLRK